MVVKAVIRRCRFKKKIMMLSRRNNTRAKRLKIMQRKKLRQGNMTRSIPKLLMAYILANHLLME